MALGLTRQGKIGHIEMMIDQKPDLLRFLSTHPQTFADIPCDNGTVLGMVAGLRFADIVEKQGQSGQNKRGGSMLP